MSQELQRKDPFAHSSLPLVIPLRFVGILPSLLEISTALKKENRSLAGSGRGRNQICPSLQSLPSSLLGLLAQTEDEVAEGNDREGRHASNNHMDL